MPLLTVGPRKFRISLMCPRPKSEKRCSTLLLLDYMYVFVVFCHLFCDINYPSTSITCVRLRMDARNVTDLL